MKNHHTPAPWTAKLHSSGGTYVSAKRNAQDCLICEYLYDEDNEPTLDELEANARLIAAAPELLQALVDLQKEIKASLNFNVKKHYSLMVADAFANKVIKKVTGE